MLPSNSRLHIALGIATANRPDILAQVLPHLAKQYRPPDQIILCAPRAEDIPEAAMAALTAPSQKHVAGPGLCLQRNHILSAAGRADLMVFFDDDFIPAHDWLAQVERLFIAHPEVVVATGHVIADGIGGPGFAADLAAQMLEQDSAQNAAAAPAPLIEVYNGYGCNMAIRMAAIDAVGARFDEALPLYGWLEDVDFSRQLAGRGTIVRASALRGVHLGTKSGRTPGRKLGYSQMANPLYLYAKGSVSARHALTLMVRNLAANSAKSLRPEPWIDRRGRLSGNLWAIADWARGRVTPQNALRMR
ncbi:MAG: glycosyltransferase family 2 protein [Sulfitobacter sp.]